MQTLTPSHIQEAERLGHNHIGCEHLLLGVLDDDGGLAAKVLTAHGMELDAVRRRTQEMCGDCSRDVMRWTYSPRATVVRQLSEVEAERLDQYPPNDAHVLLALITEGAGIPSTLFAEFDVDVPKLREDLLDALEVSEDCRATYLRQRTRTERARP